MNLNYKEIEKLVVNDRNDLNLGDASYDLTTDTIMDMDGHYHAEFFKIPPQGMVYIIAKEKINISHDIIGFAHVKTSLTQKGIMATNIGIIDPGYKGYISTLLINFGSKEYTISKGSKCLRLTFNNINSLPTGVVPKSSKGSIAKDDYINLRRNDTDNLDKKFLNLSTVSNEVLAKVFRALLALSIIFAAGSFLIAIYFQQKNSSEKDLERAIKKYEVNINTLDEENKSLKMKLGNFENIINDSKKRIEELEKKGQ